MNDHDKSNLQYILSLDLNQFKEWATTISKDDIHYATELLKHANIEISEQGLSFLEDTNIDVTEASNLLKKYML